MKSHWSIPYLVSRVRDKVYRRIHPAHPWLTPAAIKALESTIRTSDKVFEWGSGRSTLWFARLAANVVSVEHDPIWFRKVSDMLADAGVQNVEQLLREDESSYVAAAANLQDASLDVALVDGRWRGRCIHAILSKVRPGGLLVLDDSHRHIPLGLNRTYARTSGEGPPQDFEPALKTLERWRPLRTTNGVKDTVIWTRPPSQ